MDNPASCALKLLAWSIRRAPISDNDAQSQIWAVGQNHVRWLEQRRIDSLLYLACKRDSLEQRIYQKVWGVQRELLRELVTELERRGVHSLTIKGAESILDSYADFPIGLLMDVDILVERQCLGEVKAVLHSMGLRQSVFNSVTHRLEPRDVADVARLEINHYELAPFMIAIDIELEDEEALCVNQWDRHPIYWKPGTGFVVTEVDVHYSIAMDIDGSQFHSRSVPSSLGIGSTMHPSDHLWVLTSRYYNEVALNDKSSLRDFAYIAPLLIKPNLDWDLVLRIAAEMDLRPSLYYFITLLDELGSGLVPREVMNGLLPTEGKRARDWGWQLNKLLGDLEPFPLSLEQIF